MIINGGKKIIYVRPPGYIGSGCGIPLGGKYSSLGFTIKNQSKKIIIRLIFYINMIGVILAGGKGSRLGSLTKITPKPMIKIAGKPILWHILKILSSQGIKEFIICLGYKGNVIERYVSKLKAEFKVKMYKNWRKYTNCKTYIFN